MIWHSIRMQKFQCQRLSYKSPPITTWGPVFWILFVYVSCANLNGVRIRTTVRQSNFCFPTATRVLYYVFTRVLRLFANVRPDDIIWGRTRFLCRIRLPKNTYDNSQRIDRDSLLIQMSWFLRIVLVYSRIQCSQYKFYGIIKCLPFRYMPNTTYFFF